MQHTYVHKDIGEYEEKVVGKLSARMVACIAAGVAASLASAAACHLCLGIPVADAAGRPSVTRRKFRKLMRKVGEDYAPTLQAGEAQALQAR